MNTKLCDMSALAQIQQSIGELSGDEKKALALWLNSQVEPTLSGEDESELLSSLDRAVAAIDAGKGVPIEDVRRRIGTWVSK
jgi:hypothetical protein